MTVEALSLAILFYKLMHWKVVLRCKNCKRPDASLELNGPPGFGAYNGAQGFLKWRWGKPSDAVRGRSQTF